MFSDGEGKLQREDWLHWENGFLFWLFAYWTHQHRSQEMEICCANHGLQHPIILLILLKEQAKASNEAERKNNAGNKQQPGAQDLHAGVHGCPLGECYKTKGSLEMVSFKTCSSA